MFGFSVSKDMRKKGYNKGGGNREGSNIFMANTNFEFLKNYC